MWEAKLEKVFPPLSFGSPETGTSSVKKIRIYQFNPHVIKYCEFFKRVKIKKIKLIQPKCIFVNHTRTISKYIELEILSFSNINFNSNN